MMVRRKRTARGSHLMSDQQRPERPSRKNSRAAGGGDKGPGAAAGGGGLKFGRGALGWVLFIGLAVMLFMLLNSQNQSHREVALSDFLNQLEQGKVQEFTIDGSDITGEFTEPFTASGSPAGIKKFKTVVGNGGVSLDPIIAP